MFFIALVYLMAGGNSNEGLSTHSKQQVQTAQRPGDCNALEKRGSLKGRFRHLGNCVQEQGGYIEDHNQRYPNRTKLVEPQGWEIAMMYTPELMIAFLRIREFYFTFNKITSG